MLDETSSVAMMARAWRDEAFKQELLCTPRIVIEKEMQTTLPTHIEIRGFEETAQSLYLVLPQIWDVAVTDTLTPLHCAEYLSLNNGSRGKQFESMLVGYSVSTNLGFTCPKC